MTDKEKYLKSLETLIQMKDCDITKKCKNCNSRAFCEYYKAFVTAFKFIDEQYQPQPTLSKCIKEWEERDCDVIEWNNPKRYEISNVDETIYFEIRQSKGRYLVDNHCYEYTKPEIIHLLSKTLKALEEMK